MPGKDRLQMEHKEEKEMKAHFPPRDSGACRATFCLAGRAGLGWEPKRMLWVITISIIIITIIIE